MQEGVSEQVAAFAQGQAVQAVDRGAERGERGSGSGGGDRVEQRLGGVLADEFVGEGHGVSRCVEPAAGPAKVVCTTCPTNPATRSVGSFAPTALGWIRPRSGCAAEATAGWPDYGVKRSRCWQG
ncbi:hypothetical protein Sme01_14970 [Sphaerisporangium melleum]|uniref:Uncharacterized protein n=1 Tax=Sphaerisporangium melleum TaxID=321316 RepID=A0A917QUT4_9ACTN|nr:hypothetical protein GCM10007964_10570 [Sphaerisporangium melleum]GII69021.1 hypothetical protein Sme01_14970 [Sphaerisporangium melleum]